MDEETLPTKLAELERDYTRKINHIEKLFAGHFKRLIKLKNVSCETFSYNKQFKLTRKEKTL